MERNTILILYHSGAGSTKTIAEIYNEIMKPVARSVECCAISFDYNYQELLKYDLVIFGFPTYHGSPSPAMTKFIGDAPIFHHPIKAYAFTTYGLYSGHAVREFAQLCHSRNISLTGYSEYKAPATDGVLLFPPIPFMFRYERHIGSKIRADLNKIEKILKTKQVINRIPPFKMYTILNYPNQILGKRHKHKLKLDSEKCVNCNRCVAQCIWNCWSPGEHSPRYDASRCESCLKCVHHCPREAIGLTRKTKEKVKLNERFYKHLQKGIMENLGPEQPL